MPPWRKLSKNHRKIIIKGLSIKIQPQISPPFSICHLRSFFGGTKEADTPEVGVAEATISIEGAGTTKRIFPIIQGTPLTPPPIINPPPPSSPPPRAGNLSRYIENWKQNITSNSFILNIIREGYKIQLISSKFSFLPIISKPSILKRDIVFKEIFDLVLSGAISVVDPNPLQIVSRVFCVPKQNNKYRLIIDLSHLNNYVNKCSFRLEDKETIKCLIEPYDYMVSIDLCNAFHSISLHPSSKPLVTFEFENIRYSFNVIPFGLSSAPRIFTKILKPVIAYLRNRGLKISAYLDDIFICNSSYERVKQDLAVALDILRNLGFSINVQKSVLTPTQKLLHLGYIWDSTNCCIFLPENKLFKIKSLVARCLSFPQTMRTYSNLLGILVSSNNAFNFAPLFYRRFQLCFIKGLKCSFSWDSFWELDSDSFVDLSWWSSCTLPMISPVCFRPTHFIL